MERFRKENLENIKTIFEKRTGVDLEAKSSRFGAGGVRAGRSLRLAVLVMSLLVVSFGMTAFAVDQFSSLSGDEVSFVAEYQGDGIVSIEVVNQSDKELVFQPQLKLGAWITDEEVTLDPKNLEFTGTTVAADSIGVMTVDLSEACDMAALEASRETEWHYLILTNQGFIRGQEWKCSVFFGKSQGNEPGAEKDGEPPRYTQDPVIVGRVEEDLRYYFEDDYIGIFAGNPLHYEYMQKAQEIIARTPGNYVAPMDARVMAEPILDGVIIDDRVPAEQQYHLGSGQNTTVRDWFGKLAGAGEHDNVKIIKALLPGEDPADLNGGLDIPLLYFATFHKTMMTGTDDFTFIHGQLVSLDELAPYQVYEDEELVCYNVTHLFYTDLRGYVEDIAAYEKTVWDDDIALDEKAFQRIQNIYDYYQKNLKMMSWETFAELRPSCYVDWKTSSVSRSGLVGKVTSNRDIQKLTITIEDESGNCIFREDWIPDDPRSCDLKDAPKVNRFLRTAEPGTYTLEVARWIDSDWEAYGGMWGEVFTLN